MSAFILAHQTCITDEKLPPLVLVDYPEAVSYILVYIP